PGFFTLTVPTGGGKTLSSMAFALEHALEYGKKRVIMAIPFTSIIEQTAKVYKYGTDDETKIKDLFKKNLCLFGEDNVIEHHCNTDVEKETLKSRLASENWDAPIIVTTNVQLFESLFAARTSSCRKLHNLIDSIIILDEAQMLPPQYLKPAVSILKGLVEYFGVSVVLCTATQPSLEGNIAGKINGLNNVQQIIKEDDYNANIFKRVKIQMPKTSDVTENWQTIADELVAYKQVLCIVNTRKDCRELHSIMPSETVHLSANMCAEERSDKITEVKEKLTTGDDIRVVSTQLIEAGVDIDFPVVYRALAGVDSLAQAAGRCNREGKLKEQGQNGKLVVFAAPSNSPPGLLRKGEDATKTMLFNNSFAEFSNNIYSEYYKHYYSSINNFDKSDFETRLVKGACEFKFQFRTFSMDFNLIDDKAQKTIFVWYKGKSNSSYELIDLLRKKGPERWIIRKLQRFVVNIPQKCFAKILESGFIEDVHGYFVQSASGLYRPGVGFEIENANLSAEELIC
ncbi:CRISPR-associated helicase Cas3', partial [Candidatus Peregrinibacteria bacterium]|nr:CRISPR-associated helicase Cas3' [Candidatus Peregrinibacteria bacterium]